MTIDYNSDLQPLFNKDGTDYFQLKNGTVYCKPLDQSNMVGGTGEAIRNSVHNPTRLERIRSFNPKAKVLDYGCGSGMMVNYLSERGVDATGFDKYSNQYDKVPEKEVYDVVTMIEVIEHTCAPFSEIDDIYNSLKKGGTLMIETSFTDWMNSRDVYINPSIGHCTIFSHLGLDELMVSKGFTVGQHFNRNVRIYHKPEAAINTNITLITMSQGNPVALKRTLESFKGVCNEIIFGDLLIFDKDREIIKEYQQDYNLKIVKLPFNEIFLNGFGSTLNKLAEHATNDFVIYMNVSEVIDDSAPCNIKKDVNEKYNCYCFNHATETHKWYRIYNRKELQWSGLIHEEVVGDRRGSGIPAFMMKDTEKDMVDEFYAKVANDIKELTYHYQYIRLVDEPNVMGATNIGWLNYAKDSYESLKERLLAKGNRYQAFLTGDLQMYLDDIYNNESFKNELFISSDLINFQGARKDIL
jgi:hypothetical protein